MNDHDIPYTHSRQLFNVFLDDILAQMKFTIRSSSLPIKDTDYYRRLRFNNNQTHNRPVPILDIQENDEIGKIYVLHRSDCDSKVVMVEATWGTHNSVAVQGIVMDVIASFLDT